jgi:hypothetical protein
MPPFDAILEVVVPLVLLAVIGLVIILLVAGGLEVLRCAGGVIGQVSGRLLVLEVGFVGA